MCAADFSETRDGIAAENSSSLSGVEVVGIAEQTRLRLLDAAERQFADKGFAATSVRDITNLAGCNVASVNYHFGSKRGLYEAVFSRMLGQLRDQRITAVRAVADEAAARRDVSLVLRAFALAFFEPMRQPERGQVLLRLFMREMADPQVPRQMFIEQMIAPLTPVVCNAMRGAAPGLDDEAAVRCMHSLVGQLIHVVQVWQLFEDQQVPSGISFDIDSVVEHIVRFSAAGVEACGRACPESSRRACPESSRRACPESGRRACPESSRRGAEG